MTLPDAFVIKMSLLDNCFTYFGPPNIKVIFYKICIGYYFGSNPSTIVGPINGRKIVVFKGNKSSSIYGVFSKPDEMWFSFFYSILYKVKRTISYNITFC